MSPAQRAQAILESVRPLDVAGISRALAHPAHPARDHIAALADEADSEDETIRTPAVAALFGILVEPLNDGFSAEGRAAYAEIFTRIVWRVCSRDPRLRQELLAAGVPGDGELLARYRRVRSRVEAGGPLPTAPARIAVLSRVTLGADILLTSVVLQRLHQRFPHARLHLLGDAKISGLFAGMPGVVVESVAYPRRGRLGERLGGWLTIRQVLARCAPDLVVAPDSRLDQLGILPLVAEDSYLLWENLLPKDRPQSLATALDRWLVRRLGLPSDQPCLPALGLDGATEHLRLRLARSLGPQPLAAVKFDHGGNPDKALPREAEVLLLTTLRQRGWRILLDRGFGPTECANSDALLAAAHLTAIDIDESGQGMGQNIADAATGAWSEQAVIRFHGSIAGWAAAVASCRLAIAYDSVGHHLAAALGVPLVVAFTGYAAPGFPIAWQPRGRGWIQQVDIPTSRRSDPGQWSRVAAAIPSAPAAGPP